MPDIAKTIKSFSYAVKGIGSLFKSENNAQIHLIAASAAILLAIFLGFSAIEWAILIIQISIVLAAEAFNTAIEKLSDAVSTELHPLIGKAKDLAAGAVLITAIGAVITALFLFLPKFF